MAKARTTATATPETVAPEVDIVDEPQLLVGDNDIEPLEYVGEGFGDLTAINEPVSLTDEQLAAANSTTMTTTQNFMGGAPTIVDEVQELPTIVVENAPEKRIVSVTEDVGPVYYGSQLIELKRGVRYKVPEHVYRYLAERNLIWSMG